MNHSAYPKRLSGCQLRDPPQRGLVSRTTRCIWGPQDSGVAKAWLKRITSDAVTKIGTWRFAEHAYSGSIRCKAYASMLQAVRRPHFAIMDPEKKRPERSPDSRIDNLTTHQPLPTPPDDAIELKHTTTRPSGILGTFSKLGNLPEWHVPGRGQLHGKALNSAIAWCSCLAFLMFGYDQGVMSSLLTLDDFQRHFPLMTPLSRANNLCWLDAPANTVRDESMCTGNSNTQAAAVAVYQIGCFLGAVLILFYGEVWGRKSSTFWGSFIMIVGTIFQVAAGGANGGNAGAYAVLVIGRVVGGVGNGMVTSSKWIILCLSQPSTDKAQLSPLGNPSVPNPRNAGV